MAALATSFHWRPAPSLTSNWLLAQSFKGLPLNPATHKRQSEHWKHESVFFPKAVNDSDAILQGDATSLCPHHIFLWCLQI